MKCNHCWFAGLLLSMLRAFRKTFILVSRIQLEQKQRSKLKIKGKKTKNICDYFCARYGLFSVSFLKLMYSLTYSGVTAHGTLSLHPLTSACQGELNYLVSDKCLTVASQLDVHRLLQYMHDPLGDLRIAWSVWPSVAPVKESNAWY